MSDYRIENDFAAQKELAEAERERGMKTSFEILQGLCILFMCDDPTKLPEEQRNQVEIWLNDQSVKLGFTDWIEAYHYEPL